MTNGADPTLGELGEFTVIDSLVAGRRLPDSVLIGPGDDAALLAVPDGRVLVSTDMLVEGRHFRLDWSSPHQIGRKAIAQNAADIEAMGGRATGFVVAFGAPAATSARLVGELSAGMWDEADRSGGAGIIGGDLVSSPMWVISVTVLGDLDGGSAVGRDGARPGSTIAVAGHLGLSAAGYALLSTGLDDGKTFGQIRDRHCVPEPPYGQGRAAAAAGATAMTDVSDGLVADLRHIARASGTAVELCTDLLGDDLAVLADVAARLGADPWSWILGGGEDHALVACFPDALPSGWRAIGRVVDGPPAVRVDGADWTGYAGWESFN